MENSVENFLTKTTLPPLFHDLMRVGNHLSDRCVLCGKPYPLEKHHIVYRSQGELYENGVKLDKPLITLCGFGNNLPYCHGLVHHKLIHFKAVKEGDDYELYYLRTRKPTDYLTALEMGGWRKVGSHSTA